MECNQPLENIYFHLKFILGLENIFPPTKHNLNVIYISIIYIMLFTFSIFLKLSYLLFVQTDAHIFWLYLLPVSHGPWLGFHAGLETFEFASAQGPTKEKFGMFEPIIQNH